MNLTNTTVCIPGGNGGIGLELVKLLAKICKKIFVLDKDTKCEEITNLKNVEYFRLDLSHQKISNFNEQVDILIINSGLMKAEPKTFKSTTFLEIEKLIHANIRSNLRLFKDFDPKKVVIISSMLQSSGLECKSIQSACLSFFRTFNECLQSEGVNTTIVYIGKDANNLEVADSILHALNNDVKEFYVPSICATTERLRGILPEIALDAIVKNCASVNNNLISSGVTKIRTAIPEMREKLSSGVKDFMNHFNNRKQETNKHSTSSKVIKKSPNSKAEVGKKAIPTKNTSKQTQEQTKETVASSTDKMEFEKLRRSFEEKFLKACNEKIKEENIPESKHRCLFKFVSNSSYYSTRSYLRHLNNLSLDELKNLIVEPQDLNEISPEKKKIFNEINKLLNNESHTVNANALLNLINSIPIFVADKYILKRFNLDDLEITSAEKQRRFLDLFRSLKDGKAK